MPRLWNTCKRAAVGEISLKYHLARRDPPPVPFRLCEPRYLRDTARVSDSACENNEEQSVKLSGSKAKMAALLSIASTRRNRNRKRRDKKGEKKSEGRRGLPRRHLGGEDGDPAHREGAPVGGLGHGRHLETGSGEVCQALSQRRAHRLRPP